MRDVRKTSLDQLRTGIREKTGRSRGGSLARIIGDLKPKLRGWFGYCKHARPRSFATLDGFVRRRLRAILRQQEKRPSQGRSRDEHQRWPHADFANAALFALAAAWQSARQPRSRNHQLESRMRKTARTVRSERWVKAHPCPYRT